MQEARLLTPERVSGVFDLGFSPQAAMKVAGEFHVGSHRQDANAHVLACQY